MKKLLIMAVLAALTGCVTIPSSDTAVVVIGMENSKAYGNCPGAKVDSNRMAESLGRYGKVTKLQDAQATRAAVQTALARGASKEMLIIYYSGHGGQQGHGDKSETDGKDEFLCLWDGPMLDNELWAVIQSAKKTMLIIDACHSETMYRSLDTMAKAAHISGGKGEFLCWSGCPDNTFSYGDELGGRFTNALRRNYASYYTYEQVWKGIASDKTLARYQVPKQTKVGSWGGFVFR